MNSRKFFSFLTMLAGVLCANLLSSKLEEWLLKQDYDLHPYTLTWIGMLIVVLVLFPLFSYMDKWVKDITAKILKGGKSIGGKYTGLILVFLLFMAVLHYFYAKDWFAFNDIQFYKNWLENIL